MIGLFVGDGVGDPLHGRVEIGRGHRLAEEPERRGLVGLQPLAEEHHLEQATARHARAGARP